MFHRVNVFVVVFQFIKVLKCINSYLVLRYKPYPIFYSDATGGPAGLTCLFRLN